ncbi:NEDD8-conjugating enzyme Ubc12 [Chionoecetes opilio]|uniref:NEDD8-conjugating enzyme Ubc12 n=1 Tax=Chionoecetes opilio TaxID=41210 RepID=A0A8J4YXU1_CHIOP|nr:NEDD8-conjugating enzyme Ubc12 [Chionoecetes opilio]
MVMEKEGARARDEGGRNRVVLVMEKGENGSPRFHSHRVVLRSQLLALNITTFDLPTLLAAAGVRPSRQHDAIRPTCAFLRKTDINELTLPKTCDTEFPDPDDLLTFKLIICPDEAHSLRPKQHPLGDSQLKLNLKLLSSLLFST